MCGKNKKGTKIYQNFNPEKVMCCRFYHFGILVSPFVITDDYAQKC